ncbi:MAG TPA: agmatine deiminase family protein [Marmoricola sp.]|nr:agmatine deiminase family protein [Marmoricola sp.]
MPAESEPHVATWMAWPSKSYTLGETEEDAHEARSTWAAVANAIAEFEPVNMLVPPSHIEIARTYLKAAITFHEVELDDAWYRDIGPTFVLDGGRLGGVDWVFNGWGQQDWAAWEHDSKAARPAITAARAELIDSPMVNEGGGIHTDGRGTVLVTETVQLDPFRNGDWSRADVEAELTRTIGARKVIWLPRGLTRDSERFGTRGHVDIVATFASPGVVLVHDQQNPEHPDHEVSRELIELLENSTNADGRKLRVVRVPAPETLRDDEGWVDYSYINHYVCNGAVIMCAFADPSDDVAAAVLAKAYPAHEIVRVDARPLFARGGGIHCITQQQPAVGA